MKYLGLCLTLIWIFLFQCSFETKSSYLERATQFSKVDYSKVE